MTAPRFSSPHNKTVLCAILRPNASEEDSGYKNVISESSFQHAGDKRYFYTFLTQLDNDVYVITPGADSKSSSTRYFTITDEKTLIRSQRFQTLRLSNLSSFKKDAAALFEAAANAPDFGVRPKTHFVVFSQRGQVGAQERKVDETVYDYVVYAKTGGTLLQPGSVDGKASLYIVPTSYLYNDEKDIGTHSVLMDFADSVLMDFADVEEKQSTAVAMNTTTTA